MKQFIYFFKHKGVDAIKIGRTSGESVNDRFSQFKTYSPTGGEIVGFFECEDSVMMEKHLHSKLSSSRLNGEWFDISESVALSIIDKYDRNKSIKLIFNEWISNEDNDIDGLRSMLLRAQKLKRTTTTKHATIEHKLCSDNLIKSDTYNMTSTEICRKLSEINQSELSLKSVGSALVALGFEAKHIKRNKKTERLYKAEWLQF